MIWLRRILAVFLGLLLVLLFFLSLVILRINDTLLSPKLYKDDLQKENIYAFLIDDVTPVIIDENWKDVPQPPLGVTLDPQKVTEAVQRVATPEWLQAQTEQVLDEMVPYLTGQTDSFSITIPLLDRVEAAVPEVKTLLADSNLYNALSSQEFTDALDRPIKKMKGLPFGLTISSQDLVSAINHVSPPDWLQQQAEQAIDEIVPYLVGTRESFNLIIPLSDRVQLAVPEAKTLLVDSNLYNTLSDQDFVDTVDRQIEAIGGLPLGLTISSQELVSAINQVAPSHWLQLQTEQAIDDVMPYLTGETDHFEVGIPLEDRVDAAVPVLKDLLRSIDVYNLVFDQAVVTIIQKNVGELVELPFGVTITQEEMKTAARDVLHPEWIRDQVERMIDELAPYITGERDSLRLEVPLQERVDATFQVVEALVEDKLMALLTARPPCTQEQVISLTSEGFTLSLPPCIPFGATVEQVAQQLLPDLTSSAQQSIRKSLPNTFIFTDADLRSSLGAKQETLLDDILDVTRNGFRYSDTDLRSDLKKEQERLLDDILDSVRNGFQYSEADLRRDLAAQSNSSVLDDLDEVRENLSQGVTFTDADLREFLDQEAQTLDSLRDYIGTARGLTFILYVVPLVLVIGIGFLGGRQWASRIAWGAAFPAIAALIVTIVFGPVYNRISQPIFEDALTRAQDIVGKAEMMINSKAVELAQTAADDFVSGMSNQGFIALAISLVVLVLSISWPWLTRLLRWR